MFTNVMEDNLFRPLRRSVSRTLAQAALVIAAAAAGSFVGANVALAQSGDTDFRVTVVDLGKSAQKITVPLYGSVTIETSVEVTRADVVATEVADVKVVTPTRVFITGQGYGTTTVMLLSADNKQYAIEVAVELDLGRLNETIKHIDPLSNAKARSVMGNIVLGGTVSSAERASRIVDLANLFLPPSTSGRQTTRVQNFMEVAGEQQVLLRVIVAEVNRSAARELGVNGFLAGKNFRDGFLVNQIGGINPINIGAAGSSLVTENIPFVTGEDGISIGSRATLSLGFPRVQLQTFIRALAENSLLKILAEPNLVCISGETATFLAGGEFPVPEPQGFQTITIKYREFGVRLNFTPIVRGNNRIRLRVRPEVSELDFANGITLEGFRVPALTSRSLETTVELGDGETIALAGLLSEQVRSVASRIPGIGDLPVLGALFRSVEYRRSLTELVILVTVEIVAPIDAHQQVVLPTDGIGNPSDMELYALGLLESGDDMDGAGQPAGVGATEDGSGAIAASEPEELSVHGPWGHERPTGMR